MYTMDNSKIGAFSPLLVIFTTFLILSCQARPSLDINTVENLQKDQRLNRRVKRGMIQNLVEADWEDMSSVMGALFGEAEEDDDDPLPAHWHLTNGQWQYHVAKGDDDHHAPSMPFYPPMMNYGMSPYYQMPYPYYPHLYLHPSVYSRSHWPYPLARKR